MALTNCFLNAFCILASSAPGNKFVGNTLQLKKKRKQKSIDELTCESFVIVDLEEKKPNKHLSLFCEQATILIK